MTETISNEGLDRLPHVLVVDDDDRIRTLISRYLNDNGFLAFTAEDAGAAKEILQVGLFDALVVDVMMPGQDGRALTAELRHDSDIPILMLTAMTEVEDRLGGLQSGADDYLSKPFDPRELVLRLQAILRRRPKPPTGSRRFKIGAWLYDPAMPELVRDGEAVRLTDAETTLLNALLRQPNAAQSREALAAHCGVDAGERTIDVQVTRLRRKLEEDSRMPRYLQTARGRGYLLRAEEVRT